jgi:hypothetical protein
LIKARSVWFDSLSYIFHGFPGWKGVKIILCIIAEFVLRVRHLAADLLLFLTVELAVLYIGGNAMVLQPFIILFAAITRVCGDVGRFYFDILYVLPDSQGAIAQGAGKRRLQ